jgi:hypothetical protein
MSEIVQNLRVNLHEQGIVITPEIARMIDALEHYAHGNAEITDVHPSMDLVMYSRVIEDLALAFTYGPMQEHQRAMDAHYKQLCDQETGGKHRFIYTGDGDAETGPSAGGIIQCEFCGEEA